MAHTFNTDDKEVKDFSERIGFGVTKAQFTGAEAGATKDGKEYLEIGVVTEDGLEDQVRLWFTGGASNISFNTARQILVHSVSTDEKKQIVRDGVDAVPDSEQLAAMFVKAAGGECWVTKYYDPKRTYQNAQGQLRRSINTNIMGYEPKLKPELMPRPAAGQGEITKENLDQVFPGAQEVPFESKGDAPGSTVPTKDAWAK